MQLPPPYRYRHRLNLTPRPHNCPNDLPPPRYRKPSDHRPHPYYRQLPRPLIAPPSPLRLVHPQHRRLHLFFVIHPVHHLFIRLIA